MKRFFVIAVLLAIAGCTASVGTIRGPSAIEGKVVDSGGAELPGVTVTIKGPQETHVVVTNAHGRYAAKRVAPGRYTVRAELAGLQPGQRAATVVPDHVTVVDLTLNASSVSEAITVTAEAVLYPEPRPQYAPFKDHAFIDARKQPVTTFSIDVDRASYTNVRRFLAQGEVPPPDAVRVEEMINYFTYDYPQPAGREPFTITTEVAGCPWNPANRLFRIGIQGRNLDQWKMAPNNLVFLLDVSGSMEPMERLPLLKSAFRVLVDQLRAEDRVAIVVYAGAAGVVLPSTSGADKATILASLDQLEAGGSTAGGEGIELAYDIARQNFIRDGNNRVILATDGDFNVGVSDIPSLEKIIEKKRQTGIYISTIGVGDDNYQDALMEMLADKGNGNYNYLDSAGEAEKVFKRELTGTLVTIAKDVKVQLEFDRRTVASYRQIGYENRALANEDFEDDAKDAGELGAGHSVTALYEIVPASNAPGPIAAIKLRYKEPNGFRSMLLTANAVDEGRSAFEASADLQFAAAVAELGMLLRNSPHKGSASFEEIAQLARLSQGVDLDGTRGEFLRMVDSARALTQFRVATH